MRSCSSARRSPSRCYDGTRGKWRGMGWLFYGYYPAHLALIGVLRVLLWGAGASTAAGSF